MQGITLRPARPEDREPVLAFCQQNFTWGDYIPRVWDDWIADQAGDLVVATLDDGAQVGLAHSVTLTQEEAWFEGVRVAPEWRGLGIGVALTQHCKHAAHMRGATIIRACADTANIGSQTMMQRAGYSTIGEYIGFMADASTAAIDPAIRSSMSQPGPEQLERLWTWLERSNIAPLLGGLLLNGGRGVALTDDQLAQHLALHNVWMIEAWDEIQALAIVTPRKWNALKLLTIQYIDGAADYISRLALALRTLASERDCASVDVRLPDLLILHDAINGAGFERHDADPYALFACELG